MTLQQSRLDPAVIAPVRDFLARPQKLFIDGQWVDAVDGATFETIDPATGEVLTTVARGGAAASPRPST